MSRVDDFEKWTVKQWRILTTWWVGDVWYQFCIEKQDVVQRVFQNVVLSLVINVSKDHKLDIEGFLEVKIGDWTECVSDLPNPGTFRAWVRKMTTASQ